MCISINIRRTNVAFFLCLRLCTSKVPLLVLMLISSCEPGLTCCFSLCISARLFISKLQRSKLLSTRTRSLNKSDFQIYRQAVRKFALNFRFEQPAPVPHRAQFLSSRFTLDFIIRKYSEFSHRTGTHQHKLSQKHNTMTSV